jgi:hypothetical protein
MLTTVTDDAGRFELAVGPFGSLYVTADKAGYESDAQYVYGPTRDLVLHDIIKIRVGESVKITVGPDDPIWGFDDEFRSRIVHVNPSGALPIHLDLVPDGGEPGLLEVPGRACCHSRLIVPGGADVDVRILIPWDASTSRTFTLVTSEVRS